MKHFTLIALLVLSLNASLFANDNCNNFVEPDQWKYVDPMDKEGICIIDENTPLEALKYDDTFLFHNEFLGMTFQALVSKQSVAVLVSDDIMYSLDEGNECGQVCGWLVVKAAEGIGKIYGDYNVRERERSAKGPGPKETGNSGNNRGEKKSGNNGNNASND